MEETTLSRNTLAFIALANEFCQDIECALDKDKNDFLTTMAKQLPRIYIAASDVAEIERNDEEELYYIESYLTEDEYNGVRDSVYQLLGEDDVYLEVFEEDMKYSDTPIATTISENLCDLYQEFYNFVQTIKDSPAENVNEIVLAEKENFKAYWGQTLVNVMRAIHSVKYAEQDMDFDI